MSDNVVDMAERRRQKADDAELEQIAKALGTTPEHLKACEAKARAAGQNIDAVPNLVNTIMCITTMLGMRNKVDPISLLHTAAATIMHPGSAEHIINLIERAPEDGGLDLKAAFRGLEGDDE